MDNLNVKVDVQGNELIIREGTALAQKEPNKVLFSGDINTISAYISKRNNGHSTQQIDQTKMIVEVDKKALSITLNLDPENPYGATIIGKLEMSDEIKPFCINQPTTFGREQLVKLLRFNKMWFADKDKFDGILEAYRVFSASVATDISASSDNRGNKAANFAKQVKSSLPDEFILDIPIFKGQVPQSFRVEICLDATDGGAKFWFESVELNDIMTSQVDSIFSKQLELCNDFVVINK